jgi:hypothetical protein
MHHEDSLTSIRMTINHLRRLLAARAPLPPDLELTLAEIMRYAAATTSAPQRSDEGGGSVC